MGLRLAYYYSNFIVGGVTFFLSIILLFISSMPPPRKDELFTPYYLFLKLQLLLGGLELFLSLTSQRIDPTLSVVASLTGKVPIVYAIIKPDYSIFTLILGILYGLGDVLKAVYAADTLDVGVPFRPLVRLRYRTLMWFYPVVTLLGELTLFVRHIISLEPYTMERRFWVHFTMMYYSLFPTFYFVHCLMYYRNVRRPRVYADHLAAYQKYLVATQDTATDTKRPESDE